MWMLMGVDLDIPERHYTLALLLLSRPRWYRQASGRLEAQAMEHKPKSVD